MPIYEFACTQCGKVIEAYLRFSDAPLKACKHCSGKLHKLISQSTFKLKGTGWYVTDYGNKSKPSSSSKSEVKGKKPKSESASSDSKKTSKNH